jgi:ABC-type ATPase with predicted acetyltransferase domain
MAGWTYRQRLRWANDNVRTISRVIVHPQFRGVGLASALVRRIVSDCPTRYAEALAVMGRAHPFFEKAGMTRVQTAAEGAVYYLFDRKEED